MVTTIGAIQTIQDTAVRAADKKLLKATDKNRPFF